MIDRQKLEEERLLVIERLLKRIKWRTEQMLKYATDEKYEQWKES